MSWGCRHVIAAMVVTVAVGCGQREPPPRYAEVRAILDRHCVSCHAAQNTSKVFPLAPLGVELETSTDVRRHAARIRQRTVVDRTMPLLNKTEMTEAERAVVDRWVAAGAPLR